MKVLENKKVSIGNVEMTYVELIASQIKSTPAEGFTYEVMEKIMRVDAFLDKKLEKIELEDADFDFIKEKISKATWAIYDTQIVDMVKYIKSL